MMIWVCACVRVCLCLLCPVLFLCAIHTHTHTQTHIIDRRQRENAGGAARGHRRSGAERRGTQLPGIFTYTNIHMRIHTHTHSHTHTYRNTNTRKYTERARQSDRRRLTYQGLWCCASVYVRMYECVRCMCTSVFSFSVLMCWCRLCVYPTARCKEQPWHRAHS